MRINSCMSFIRRHISAMRDGQIFTTGDCLVYGKRSNVDDALYRCVRAGYIRRLARGVFVRPGSNFELPTEFEIAKIKAARFGKEILTHPADTCAKHGLLPNGNAEPTFYVDGSTSRFQYRGTYIYLRRANRKRMHMPDDRAGLSIRALWHIGRRSLKKVHIDKLDKLWNWRTEKEKIFRGKAWMPAWLGDQFLTGQYMGPFPIGYSTARHGP